MVRHRTQQPSPLAARPEPVAPMLATPGALPSGPGWAFEVKWDGVRAGALAGARGDVLLVGRHGTDFTAAFPEITEALQNRLPARALALDGEIVCFDKEGQPSFALLQQRLHLVQAGAIERAARASPATYLPFDVPHLDLPLLHLPYVERRSILSALALGGTGVRVPPHWVESGPAALAFTREQHLEGLIAKRMASLYTPGRRSLDWIKVKNLRTADLVIGGWIAAGPAGGTALKAVLCGVRTADGLRYAGKVGSGFAMAERRALAALLRRLECESSPFSTAVTGLAAGEVPRWTRPTLTAEVEYLHWTEAGRLRHPVWRGLRGPQQ
ncbi:bifunctional non-homologous end joining protein LigD [Kitasatospora sp. MAA4]|uniref:non-homologous end-joining DNA ligase n=1 Tax=Kitasatospora sp. MAA4 TaxID=3035093 RepID=UPI0024762633|nr:non-homologous end-joining DNA ligase [Kitasatospora sp. MAA4]MDH6137867.1 bifunctional non-homologous end joining protein LigD [Kitasatospora sp. MAA4]